MEELSKKPYFFKDYKLLFILTIISFIASFISLQWQFWLIFGIGSYIILIIYFSKEFRSLLNIHFIAISLIVLYALPSSILILQDKIPLDNDERLVIFSAISIGLIGYSLGALCFRKLFSFEKKKNARLAKNLNALFWLAYKYRYVLMIICCLLLLYRGFTSLGMSYRESVVYRMETLGVIQYFNSLFTVVFSLITITIISIIGDINKYRKLSLLSYFLIVMIILNIVGGGNRSLAISLIVCLIIVFQPYLKRRHILLIGVLSIILVLVISGGVRYARSGTSITENINNFYEYFLNVEGLTSLFWGFSDFTVPFSTFITLVKNIPKNIDFDYSAYIKDFSLLIPTVIYPGRPLPYNQWYVKTFEPELFRRGGGLTSYVLGFGYLFAGPIGVLIHLFLFGALFEWFNKFFRMVSGAASLFLYACFFMQVHAFVVGCGFIVYIKGILMYFFIPIFLLFLFVLILDSLNLKRCKYLR